MLDAMHPKQIIYQNIFASVVQSTYDASSEHSNTGCDDCYKRFAKPALQSQLLKSLIN